jgi:hypothetical protein
MEVLLAPLFLGKLMLYGGQVRFHLLVSAVFALTFSSAPVLGCKCVSPPPDIKTARDLAQWTASRSDAIFEGRVERIELKWPLLEAKVGGLVSADIDQDPPVMEASFEVSRSYRGAQQKSILIKTGVGGGDCGFHFEVGEQYLVYAFADESGHLSTGICSGTALLEESKANLSYLRREPVGSETVERNRPIDTQKLCGRAVRTGFDFTDSQVFLIRVGNKSPIPTDEAELARDGSFCVTEVIPGKYHLLFINRAEDSPTSFVFFPGVVKSSEATAIEVKSGRAMSDLVFDVPPQPTFSVSGTVRASNKSPLSAECKVALLSAEPLSFLLAYSQDVGPSGTFDFRNVLPGKYWAFVTVDSDSATNWLTRKVEVNVEVSVADLSLELVAK